MDLSYLAKRLIIGISISSVNQDPRGDCPVWRFEVGKFFSVGMEEKIPPKEVWGWGWGWGWYFILRPRRLHPRKLLK
jgi:hypothetical protein